MEERGVASWRVWKWGIWRSTAFYIAAGITAVVILALLLIGIGFGVGRWTADEDPPPAALIGPQGTIELTDESPVYVALGDSYAAGEGLDVWLSGTQDTQSGGNRCHRSPLAYAPILALLSELPLRFDSCSGAEIENIFDKVQQHNSRPVAPDVQGTTAELGDDVGLVTISIGGNDLGFASVVRHCGLSTNCLAAPYGGSPTLKEWGNAALASIAERLEPVYKRIGSEAQEARVLVIGYPALFSDPFSLSGGDFCEAYGAAFSGTERTELNQLLAKANGIMRDTALANGLEYVETADVFRGHETCGPATAWLQFVGPRVVDDGNFHPNTIGHQAIGRLIECYLEVNPDPVSSEAQNRTDDNGRVERAYGASGDDVYSCFASSAAPLSIPGGGDLTDLPVIEIPVVQQPSLETDGDKTPNREDEAEE
jgi:lysophospholipase L1-like esterase